MLSHIGNLLVAAGGRHCCGGDPGVRRKFLQHVNFLLLSAGFTGKEEKTRVSNVSCYFSLSSFKLSFKNGTIVTSLFIIFNSRKKNSKETERD